MAGQRRSLFSIPSGILSSNRTSLDRLQSPNFSSSSAIGQSLSIDLSNEESKRRLFFCDCGCGVMYCVFWIYRLLYRDSCQHPMSYDEQFATDKRQPVEENVPDLWEWLIGEELPPEPVSVPRNRK
ncbi:succinate dehydrogenase assembly factor [Striga asiatica]|uniref:Succinate dehydrogenase assembly factor n=1 Tax=Striga asiatica TaxID=4170 RepID=A0A5A7QVS9_STRAF|nr:succinate dehydrogenase assembly factor [Striga asiatica]